MNFYECTAILKIVIAFVLVCIYINSSHSTWCNRSFYNNVSYWTILPHVVTLHHTRFNGVENLFPMVGYWLMHVYCALLLDWIGGSRDGWSVLSHLISTFSLISLGFMSMCKYSECQQTHIPLGGGAWADAPPKPLIWSGGLKHFTLPQPLRRRGKGGKSQHVQPLEERFYQAARGLSGTSSPLQRNTCFICVELTLGKLPGCVAWIDRA